MSPVCLVNTKVHKTVTQWMEFHVSVSEEYFELCAFEGCDFCEIGAHFFMSGCSV